jgi:putative transposase
MADLVPPQNPVERAIVDVFKLRIELTYPMLRLLYALLATARSSPRLQRELALENLALRQQLAILQRKTKRPRLTNADRVVWVALCGLWPDWQSAVILVKPKTVISWHRKGFRFYWTCKSRHRGGRLRIDPEIRTLIRRMARENPTWGAPRVHGELLMLGFEVGEATVSR